MASHIIDFLTLGNNFGTAEMRDVWSETNRLKKHIEIEIALAKAEGELGVIPKELGVIPKEAAQQIAASTDPNKFDLETISQEIARLPGCVLGLSGRRLSAFRFRVPRQFATLGSSSHKRLFPTAVQSLLPLKRQWHE